MFQLATEALSIIDALKMFVKLNKPISMHLNQFFSVYTAGASASKQFVQRKDTMQIKPVNRCIFSNYLLFRLGFKKTLSPVIEM